MKSSGLKGPIQYPLDGLTSISLSLVLRSDNDANFTGTMMSIVVRETVSSHETNRNRSPWARVRFLSSDTALSDRGKTDQYVD